MKLAPVVRAGAVLLLAQLPARASDAYPGPAEHLKVLADSKLHYEIGNGTISEEERTRGMSELSCGRRLFAGPVTRVDGELKFAEWELSPEAREAWQHAESHFEAGRPDEADLAYREIRRLAPEFPLGWLFSGDISFQKGAYEEALEFYRKAVELDPTLAQAHRFEAHALERLRRDDEAIEALVHAVALDPLYEEAFDALERVARIRGMYVERHPFRPAARIEQREKSIGITFELDAKGVGWLPYAICKAVWKFEPEYRRSRLETGPREYVWTTLEEEECLVAQFLGATNAARARLEEGAAGAGGGEPTDAELTAELTPFERHLEEVGRNGLLSGYVLFEVIGSRCPSMLGTIEDDQLEEVRRYVREHVLKQRIPATSPVQPTSAPTSEPASGDR